MRRRKRKMVRKGDRRMTETEEKEKSAGQKEKGSQVEGTCRILMTPSWLRKHTLTPKKYQREVVLTYDDVEY